MSPTLAGRFFFFFFFLPLSHQGSLYEVLQESQGPIRGRASMRGLRGIMGGKIDQDELVYSLRH